MRGQTEESAGGINHHDPSHEISKYQKTQSPNFHDEDFRGSHNESANDYYRDSLIDIEDQVQTSKLVLQLVTDSRFNMTQINGQRKLGGPPPGWKGPAPGPGCEVFVGKIPRTLYEYEIYPIFRRMGEVYEIRLMMDFSGTNRGYCFVMFGKPEFADKAIRELDNFEIRPGRRIGVVASINNCRLYVGQLPPDVQSETVIKKIYEITDDVGQVAVYRNTNDQARYALISYKTHRGAAMARRRLVPDRAALFGGAEVSIDWAHPSMFPSNVVEDTGICNEDGNIEISRLIVGNENKRYQNRRRTRDDFLDHSIRAYLQSDRALDQIQRKKQHSSENQGFNNCLGNVARGINGFHIFDQNSILSNAQGYSQRHNNCGIETARISRESNSPFDFNVGSGSSESSGCSSQSSASDRNQNVSREFSDLPVNNFSKNLGSRSCSESGDQNIGKTDRDSLNLFDNYTFSSSNCQEMGNQAGFNDARDNGDCFLSVFENGAEDDLGKIVVEEKYAGLMESGENFSPKFAMKIERENEKKFDKKNSQAMRGSRNYFNREVNNRREISPGVYAANKSAKSTFPKAIGTPFKNEPLMRYGNLENSKNLETLRNRKDLNFISPPSSPMNLQLCRQNEDNRRTPLNRDWQSVAPLPSLNVPHFSNFPRSQNRNEISSAVWNKNNKNATSPARMATGNNHVQQPQYENCANRGAYPSGKIAASLIPPNVDYNFNSDVQKAWFSAQLAINGLDFSSSNSGNDFVNNSIFYSNTELSREQAALRTSTTGFISQAHSQHRNFYPAQNISTPTQSGNCHQNKRVSNGKCGPKNGRPILNRSSAYRSCNEN